MPYDYIGRRDMADEAAKHLHAFLVAHGPEVGSLEQLWSAYGRLIGLGWQGESKDIPR